MNMDRNRRGDAFVSPVQPHPAAQELVDLWQAYAEEHGRPEIPTERDLDDMLMATIWAMRRRGMLPVSPGQTPEDMEDHEWMARHRAMAVWRLDYMAEGDDEGEDTL